MQYCNCSIYLCLLLRSSSRAQFRAFLCYRRCDQMLLFGFYLSASSPNSFTTLFPSYSISAANSSLIVSYGISEFFSVFHVNFKSTLTGGHISAKIIFVHNERIKVLAKFHNECKVSFDISRSFTHVYFIRLLYVSIVDIKPFSL